MNEVAAIKKLPRAMQRGDRLAKIRRGMTGKGLNLASTVMNAARNTIKPAKLPHTFGFDQGRFSLLLKDKARSRPEIQQTRVRLPSQSIRWNDFRDNGSCDGSV